MLRLAAAAATVLALAAPSTARAGGGFYIFDGGTPAQRSEVRSGLEASAFDWSIVHAMITIHIRRGIESEATPGHIWLDSDLLGAKRFAWGVVQHEYAHEVDFLVLTDDQRDALAGGLGGAVWCCAAPGLRHDELGCERFASTLAWAYWPSPENSMRPFNSADESAALPPAEFRALLTQLLGVPDRVRERAAARPVR